MEQKKVKLRWSYFRLPGFRRARDGCGFVPCKLCIQKKVIPECEHDSWRNEKWN